MLSGWGEVAIEALVVDFLDFWPTKSCATSSVPGLKSFEGLVALLCAASGVEISHELFLCKMVGLELLKSKN